MPRSTPPGTEPARARTLPGLLRARVAATPGAEALRFEDSSLTCAELLAAAEALASRLRDAGVGPGDRVACCDVQYRVWDDVIHGFAAMPGTIPEGRESLVWAGDALRLVLGR